MCFGLVRFSALFNPSSSSFSSVSHFNAAAAAAAGGGQRLGLGRLPQGRSSSLFKVPTNKTRGEWEKVFTERGSSCEGGQRGARGAAGRTSRHRVIRISPGLFGVDLLGPLVFTIRRWPFILHPFLSLVSN